MLFNKSFSKNIIPFFILGVIVFALNGCTSYQPVADNDGIYSSDVQKATEYSAEGDKNNYYQQYFSTKAAQLEEIPEENLIFTDIEAYSTSESLDEEGYVVVEEKEEDPYGGWGTNGGNVTVNIYDTGWNNFGWYGGWYGGWYQPWNFYGYWGNPYWGWGYGFYNPWNWGPFFGGYYCSPYYYGGGYGSYGYAYHAIRGRSNASYIAGRSNINRGRSNITNSRSNYSRSENYRRSNNNYSREARTIRSSRDYNSNRRSNTNYRPQNNTRPSYNAPNNSRPNINTRPSYSRPSNSGGSGSFNRGGGGTSRGGGGRSGGRG